MKKIIFMLLFVFFVVFVSSCNKETPVDESKPTEDSNIPTNQPTNDNTPTKPTVNEDNMIKETENEIILSNDYIKVIVAKSNGSITSVVNAVTGRDFISGSKGGNWALNVDLSTNDPYKTNLKSTQTKRVNSRSFAPEIVINEEEELALITLKYDVSVKNGSVTFDGITVNCYISLSKNTNELEINYNVENNLNTPSVIVNFTGLIVSGLKDSEGTLNLFWPNKEGKIYSAGVKKAVSTFKVSEQYPSPVSMQLVQLYDEEDSLYYFVKDNTREYKEFNFGAFNASGEYDNGSVTIQDKVSLSCTQYPFISNGNSKDLWTTVLGTDTEKEWYSGSDSYREFLIESKMNREYNKYVSEWTGFSSTTISSFGNNMKSPYVGTGSPDKVISDNDSNGVDSVVLFGWHEGGFDSMYPDYNFFEGEGYGEENFIKMVESAHANGDKVLPYLNAHITALNSNWGNSKVSNTSLLTNVDNSAIKKVGFNRDLKIENYRNYMYYETYNTTTGYYATCPASDEFIAQISSVVERLASCGVDGLWMDQMMEMPANLCYDSTHNHVNPATAYGEGYKRMYTSIDQIFKKYNIDYLIFAEGTTDAWIEYIDICSYMWARKLYSPDNVNPGDGQTMSPNITKYTIPAKFLGIESYETVYNHAHAFLFGSPIKGPNSVDAEIIRVYEENKEIYMYGRYMDTLGINYENKFVLSSVITSKENSLGIQFYNNSDSNQNVFLEINLEELGIEGNITNIINMFDNSQVEFNGNKVMIEVAANSPTAIKVIYK